MTAAGDDERLARLALSMVREPGDLWLTTSVSEVGGVALRDHLLRARGLPDDLREVADRLGRVDPERELDPRRAARAAVRGPRRRRVAGAGRRPARTPSPWTAWAGCRSGCGCAGRCGSTRSPAPSRSSAPGRRRRTATTWPPRSPRPRRAPAGCVVSGGAFGIDVAAHRGALAAGGATVAVLACGADRVYPQAHSEILEHIAEHGAVVSESPPGHAPFKARFLSRNRRDRRAARGARWWWRRLAAAAPSTPRPGRLACTGRSWASPVRSPAHRPRASTGCSAAGRRRW